MARKLSARAQSLVNAQEVLLDQYSVAREANEKVQRALLQIHEDDLEDICEVEGATIDAAYELFSEIENGLDNEAIRNSQSAREAKRLKEIEQGYV